MPRDIDTPSNRGEWQPTDDIDLTGPVTEDDIDLAVLEHNTTTALAKANEALRRLDHPMPPTGKRRPAHRREV